MGWENAKMARMKSSREMMRRSFAREQRQSMIDLFNISIREEEADPSQEFRPAVRPPVPTQQQQQQQQQDDEINNENTTKMSNKRSINNSTLQLLSSFSKYPMHKNNQHNDDNHEDAQNLLAADIAEAISSELKTVGLIAALLSSWGSTVYAGETPIDGGLCFGEPMLRWTYVLFWISLGWFFLCVSSTLVVVADLDSIPQHLLVDHLRQTTVQLIYQVPELSMIGGVIFLAIAYALDIGERSGCAFLYFGLIAAPGFVGCVFLMFWLLRSDRQKLNDKLGIETHKRPLGTHFIATWRDRIETIEDEAQAIAAHRSQFSHSHSHPPSSYASYEVSLAGDSEKDVEKK